MTTSMNHTHSYHWSSDRYDTDAVESEFVEINDIRSRDCGIADRHPRTCSLMRSSHSDGLISIWWRARMSGVDRTMMLCRPLRHQHRLRYPLAHRSHPNSNASTIRRDWSQDRCEELLVDRRVRKRDDGSSDLRTDPSGNLRIDYHEVGARLYDSGCRTRRRSIGGHWARARRRRDDRRTFRIQEIDQRLVPSPANERLSDDRRLNQVTGRLVLFHNADWTSSELGKTRRDGRDAKKHRWLIFCQNTNRLLPHRWPQ